MDFVHNHFCPQIDQQIRWSNESFHQVKQGFVIAEIPVGHKTHGMQVGRKDVGILINGSILNDVLAAFPNLENLSEARVQEINLQVEGPTLHGAVKVIQVGILSYRFKMGFPFVVLCQ